MILNVGCGKEVYGDVRVDVYWSPAAHIICDAHFLPFRENIFNEVYSKNLFEHLRNPFNALYQQKRVLKNGGKIVLITDHASYWHHHIRHKSLHIIFARKRRFDAHYGIYLPIHLKNYFEALGMQVTQLSYVRQRIGGITGLINRFLVVHPVLKCFAYPRIKVIAVKKK